MMSNSASEAGRDVAWHRAFTLEGVVLQAWSCRCGPGGCSAALQRLLELWPVDAGLLALWCVLGPQVQPPPPDSSASLVVGSVVMLWAPPQGPVRSPFKVCEQVIPYVRSLPAY